MGEQIPAPVFDTDPAAQFERLGDTYSDLSESGQSLVRKYASALLGIEKARRLDQNAQYEASDIMADVISDTDDH